jgi:DnaJ-class molecular chaperone
LQGTQRIIGIAEAARTSFSVHPAALEVITTRLEAYAFLGVNANASEAVLKKAVNALRECWHPDLATDEEDRRLREIRIKQINVAWDLITGKQMSY